jgi:inositol 3-alpha-galactosyltransferase
MAPDITTTILNTTVEKPKVDGGKGRAFVTFLAGNADYIKGVVGLAKGLRKTKTMYPLVVAILPDVPQEHRKILVSQGCIVKEIAPVYPPPNQTQFAMAYYVINYSKLRIFEVQLVFVHQFFIYLYILYGFACVTRIYYCGVTPFLCVCFF